MGLRTGLAIDLLMIIISLQQEHGEADEPTKPTEEVRSRFEDYKKEVAKRKENHFASHKTSPEPDAPQTGDT